MPTAVIQLSTTLQMFCWHYKAFECPSRIFLTVWLSFQLCSGWGGTPHQPRREQRNCWQMVGCGRKRQVCLD